MTTTTPREWRKARQGGIEVTLPSYGDTVLIRPMDAEFFFKTGRVPDFLAPTVRKIISGAGWDRVPEPPDDNDEEIQEWVNWLNELIMHTFVQPKVVNDPQADDEIGIDEIAYADKMFVYSLFGLPAAALRKFRERQVKSMEPVAEKQDVYQAPVSDNEYSSVGQSVDGDGR